MLLQRVISLLQVQFLIVNLATFFAPYYIAETYIVCSYKYEKINLKLLLSFFPDFISLSPYANMW